MYVPSPRINPPKTPHEVVQMYKLRLITGILGYVF